MPWERLEADELSSDDARHLAACPRCRIDRRLLREAATDGDVPGIELARAALKSARLSASESLAESWRSSRSESQAIRRPVDTNDLLPAGIRLGNYVVDGLLGRGGMAVVYRVEHAELRTSHALKVLTAPGATLRMRLLREGRLQGRLRHRNVVGVTDVVELDSAPALILEYVAGPSLDRLLRCGRLPTLEADAIAIDILTGVAAAHARGFVHRDLKPSNVLLDPSGDTLVAKVADFGLAKALEGEQVDHLQTRTGGVLGTLVYMAPEQIRDARNTDARSDVFALGALLYELVSGQRCFAGVDMVDIVGRVTSATRAPLPGDVPIRMARAIDAALAVDPVQRPESAAALLEAWIDGRSEPGWSWSRERLDALAELHEVTLLPASTADPTLAEARSRWPMLLGLAGLGAFLLMVAAPATWALWPGSPPTEASVMLVHELPGAQGRAGGTTVTAVVADDLGGLYTAACVDSTAGCAVAEPAPDGWVPLVDPPSRGMLRTDLAGVALGGIPATASEGWYRGTGHTYEPGSEPIVALSGASEASHLRLPALPGLRLDASRPLAPREGEAVTLTWQPGGGGTPFVEIRPRGGPGRLYHLVDDGSFDVPAEALPAAPSQTDLVFGRTARTSMTLGGVATEVVARTQQWLTVVRVDEGREFLPGIGHCEQTKVRPPLESGRYWMLLDLAGDYHDPLDWPCFPRSAVGMVPVYPVAVAAGTRRAVRVVTPAGDPFLWLAENPYCMQQNCLRAIDRPGTSEVVILEPPGDADFVYNVAIADASAAGGIALIDVVDLQPPESQVVSVEWISAEPTRVEVRIENPADVEFRLGFAETRSPNGWYGEDCLNGSTREGIQQCHPVVGASVTLVTVDTMDRVRAGQTTLFWPAIGEIVTGYLEASNLVRDDGGHPCWVWGDEPDYYAEQGCSAVPEAPPLKPLGTRP